MTRLWQSRPPPGFPLPLYARAQDDDVRRRAIPGGKGRGVDVLPVEPRSHADGSSRKFVVWTVMPPDSWIRLPRFFADELPSRGPLELSL